MADKAINEFTILANIESTPYLKFPVLEQFDFIKHGFSTKLGGVSKGIYESMNLGFHRGDDDSNVRENYRLICESIGINANDLVFTDQVHKANVRVATKNDLGKGILHKRDYKEIDGHITNESGVPLLVFAADCVPIFFVDPVKKAIGATHSGWRGTVQKIAKVTVEEMRENYDSNPEDIIAVIGPCICKDCYEVSKDVADAFKSEFKEEEVDTFLTAKSDEKYQLDLWEANRLILQNAGLTNEHITVSSVCTMCNPDLLYSHRRNGDQRGSLAGFLSIQD